MHLARLRWVLPALLAAATALAGDPAREAAWRQACDASSQQVVLQAQAAGLPNEARGVWMDATRLRFGGASASGRYRLHASRAATLSIVAGRVAGAEAVFDLDLDAGALPAELQARFAWVGDGVNLRLRGDDAPRLRALLSAQWLLVREGVDGRVQQSTGLQWAALIDALFADAAASQSLDPVVGASASRVRVFAPTAQSVVLCRYPAPTAAVLEAVPMRRNGDAGTWTFARSEDLRGQGYLLLVDVVVPGVGLVRNRVTDPYSTALSANSARSLLVDLADAASKPEGWDRLARDKRLRLDADQVIYELHVRDFSASDASVPADQRGKYAAFTVTDSAGMRHLRALAAAGLSDVHLLPVFDFATVPEIGCGTPVISGSGDSSAPQAAVLAAKSTDCFNWGYDPLHFGVPEGSYASDANDALARIREFRAMVLALNRAGLRVGMDVVYNHTSASGQDARSVLDRIVPGYYHRLDAQGRVTTSTCCANTATEQRMMAKLMIDTAARFVRDYRIEAFRFDLMGHQPRAAMEELQRAVDAVGGRHVPLLGEGWNFGEVANGARFVQASQLSLNGSGIATFSDRARDAVRGGSAMDNDARLVSAQGFVTGLHYDRNAQALGSRDDLLRAADLVRVGLAGSLRDYVLSDYRGQSVRLDAIRYGDQPAGYVSAPDEVVNYVENHDNHTFFDITAFKLPDATTSEERTRVQMLAAAINLFSQGIAYFHAGFDVLRSKSLDRNSYDSGDWFNRIDWTYQDNGFASGLPPQPDNGNAWALLRPLLTNVAIKPEPAQIGWMRDVFRDLLRIRASSTLFRLRSAADIHQRLRFVNTGPTQEPTVLAALIDGAGYPGAGFATLAYFVNVDIRAHDLALPETAGRDFVLHPVQRNPEGADARAREAVFHREQGRFTLPPRTAVVFVVE